MLQGRRSRPSVVHWPSSAWAEKPFFRTRRSLLALAASSVAAASEQQQRDESHGDNGAAKTGHWFDRPPTASRARAPETRWSVSPLARRDGWRPFRDAALLGYRVNPRGPVPSFAPWEFFDVPEGGR